ncbi:MAG: ATP-dependent Clp protease proteolytic subunit [Syntrophales bacterium]|nr:ATP-dependent Clp protease proteolytic subunit [Syntrophales bacterium]
MDAYFTINALITSEAVRTWMQVITNVIREKNPSGLYFLISTSGGFVNDAKAFFSFLRALPIKKVMHNMGNIESVGNIIFVAADERYANPAAHFLLHGLTWNFNAAAQVSHTQIQEINSALFQGEEDIAQILVTQTKLTKEEIFSLYKQGESKGLGYAIEKGLINEIREARIPPGAFHLVL